MLESDGLLIKIFKYFKKKEIRFIVIDLDLRFAKKFRHYFYYAIDPEDPLKLQYLSWNYKDFIADVVVDSYYINLKDLFICWCYVQKIFNDDCLKIFENKYIKEIRVFQSKYFFDTSHWGIDYVTAYLNLTAYIISVLHIVIIQNGGSRWSKRAWNANSERLVNDWLFFLEQTISLVLEEVVLDLLHIEKISRYELWYHHYTFTGIIWTFLDWNYMRLKKCFKFCEYAKWSIWKLNAVNN